MTIPPYPPLSETQLEYILFLQTLLSALLPFIHSSLSSLDNCPFLTVSLSRDRAQICHRSSPNTAPLQALTKSQLMYTTSSNYLTCKPPLCSQTLIETKVASRPRHIRHHIVSLVSANVVPLDQTSASPVSVLFFFLLLRQLLVHIVPT
jgi:hypothetical protein